MRAFAVIPLLLVSVTAISLAGRADWTGSAKCGSCHPAELAAWQLTAHAQTRARFASAPPKACMACHGTGEAPAGPAIEVAIGCEACHGAGAAYAEDDIMRSRTLSTSLGMIDTSALTPKARAAICAGCHARRTTGTAFDATAAVHRVTKP